MRICYILFCAIGLPTLFASAAPCQGMRRVGEDLCVAITPDGRTCIRCDNQPITIGTRIPVATNEKCPSISALPFKSPSPLPSKSPTPKGPETHPTGVAPGKPDTDNDLNAP
jgi:hypothetical protein